MDDLLTDPATGTMASELMALAAALKSMKRANSGLTWIRQKHVTAFLRGLAVTPSITHESLDELPNSRTREYVRGLLVEHRALPRRDEFRVRYDDWANDALHRVSDPQNRELVRRYVRWHHQRKMNQTDEVSRGTFLRSKQTVTVAIDFVNWLDDRAIGLAELRQGHLDAWRAEGPTTRGISDRFLKWAIKTHAAPPGLKMTPHRRRTSNKLDPSAQDEAVQRVVHTDELTPRDRAAAILILVFGQQTEDIVRLTWEDVTATEQMVTVRLGGIQIALPAPLDTPWRQLASVPVHDLTAAHPNTNWVFRGTSPGKHIHPGHLRQRLRSVFSARAARLGTLHELTKLAPVAVIAEALGYSAATIERHSVDSLAACASYVAAVSEVGRGRLASTPRAGST